MKKFLIACTLAATALVAPSAFAGDVGVSISVGQPGFYGRIDVGNARPSVIYDQPVLVQRVYAPPPPVYLRVPVYHSQHWSRHCHAYGACGRPVYFVREDWYARTYAPAYYGRPQPHPYPVYGPPGHWDGHRGDGWDRGRRDWDDRRGHREWDERRTWDDRRGHDDHRGHRGGDWDGRGDRGDRGDRHPRHRD